MSGNVLREGNICPSCKSAALDYWEKYYFECRKCHEVYVLEGVQKHLGWRKAGNLSNPVLAIGGAQ